MPSLEQKPKGANKHNFPIRKLHLLTSLGSDDLQPHVVSSMYVYGHTKPSSKAWIDVIIIQKKISLISIRFCKNFDVFIIIIWEI